MSEYPLSFAGHALIISSLELLTGDFGYQRCGVSKIGAVGSYSAESGAHCKRSSGARKTAYCRLFTAQIEEFSS
jgi:hypothetical protein